MGVGNGGHPSPASHSQPASQLVASSPSMGSGLQSLGQSTGKCQQGPNGQWARPCRSSRPTPSSSESAHDGPSFRSWIVFDFGFFELGHASAMLFAHHHTPTRPAASQSNHVLQSCRQSPPARRSATGDAITRNAQPVSRVANTGTPVPVTTAAPALPECMTRQCPSSREMGDPKREHRETMATHCHPPPPPLNTMDCRLPRPKVGPEPFSKPKMRCRQPPRARLSRKWASARRLGGPKERANASPNGSPWFGSPPQDG